MWKFLERMMTRKKKEETKMEDTNKPVFKKAGISGDGKVPAKTPWGASVRTPITITVPPATAALGEPGRVLVKFGLSCDRPILAWPHKNVGVYGLSTPTVLQVLQPNDEITLVLENKTTRPVEISESTALLDVAFLTAADFDVR